ncbi:MAG: hypothetical protein U9N72_07085 [Bacteroidota bacterium]|nr:hypothetical protein [Bacteroidota bacterium]
MKNNITGKTLESKTYRILYRDGIFDLAMGSMLIIYSINMYLHINNIDTPFIIRILLVPIVLVLAMVKIFITQKRIGYVKFRRSRNRKRLMSFIIATAALVLTTIIYILAASGKIESEQKNTWLSLLIEFVFLLSVFFLMAYFTDYYKFYIIGLAMGFGGPVSKYLEPYPGTRYFGLAVVFTVGSFLLASGIIMLITFLNQFPKTVNNES